MNFKKIFLGTLFSTMAFAQPEIISKNAIKSGFYVGGAAGLGSFSGKRSEDYSGLSGTSSPEILSPKNRFQDKAGVGELNAGYLFIFSPYGLTLSPELRWSFGTLRHEIKHNWYDQLAATDGNYTSTLQNKTRYEGVLRLGKVFCDSFHAYVLAGFSQAKFENSYAFILDPTIKINNKQGKTRTGALLGIGVEKQINDLRIGIEGSYVKYPSFSFIDHPSSEGKLNTRFSPRLFRFQLRMSYIF